MLIVADNEAQTFELLDESVFESALSDSAGHVEHQVVTVADAGGGAGVAPLPAQDEVDVAHVRAHGLRQFDPAQVGQGVRAVAVPFQLEDDVNDGLL